jgi:hypothetical protein
MAAKSTEAEGTRGSPPSPQGELWPWTPRVAVLLVPVILVVLAVGVAVLRNTAGWPSDAYQGWTSLAVVLLALVPILLVVVQLIARTGGELKVAGVALSFAAASQEAAAAVRTTNLEENLGASADDAVERTSLSSVRRALRRARDSDVTVIDLRAGHTWWESRLLILVAGAARRERPQTLAFVGDRNGRRGIFLGWASPSRLLDLHLASDPSLAKAHSAAVTKAAQWELGVPQPGDASVLLPWNSQQVLRLPFVSDASPDPGFAFELFLQETLEIGPDREPSFVTIARLQQLYEAALVTDHVEAGSRDEVWIDALRREQRPFFAVTADGKLKSLVPREALLTALVIRLAETDSAARR